MSKAALEDGERHMSNNHPDAHADELASDLLRGARAISEFTGDPLRRVTYLLETGRLPAGKHGAIWVASKRRLREYYDRLTAGPGEEAA